MHFELWWLDVYLNFTGSSSIDVNLCLVWVVLRGPVEIQGIWKAGAWIYACCLAFRTEEEVPVMTDTHVPRTWKQCCWSNALPGCVSSAAHSCVEFCVMEQPQGQLSMAGLHYLGQHQARNWFVMVPLSPTETDQQRDPGESDEHQICCLSDSSLEPEPSVVWEGWGFCPLVRKKEHSSWWELTLLPQNLSRGLWVLYEGNWNQQTEIYVFENILKCWNWMDIITAFSTELN